MKNLKFFLKILCGIFLLWLTSTQSYTASAARHDQDNDVVEGFDDAIVSEDISNATPIKDEDPYDGVFFVINVAARELKVYDGLLDMTNGDQTGQPKFDVDSAKLIVPYPVAVGSPVYQTPVARYPEFTLRKIPRIEMNPSWTPPSSPWAVGAKFDPPGPKNTLGRTKFPMLPEVGVRIHGTNKKLSVGHAASHGCLRMITEDALELARFVQMVTVLGMDVGKAYKQATKPVVEMDDSLRSVFEQYDKNMYRTFVVPIPAEKQVPVLFIYQLGEVVDDTLFVYQDVYGRYPGASKIEHLRQVVDASGINPDDVDWEFVSQQIKDAKNADISFALEDLLVDKNQRLSYMTP